MLYFSIASAMSVSTIAARQCRQAPNYVGSRAVFRMKDNCQDPQSPNSNKTVQITVAYELAPARYNLKRETKN